MRFKVLLLVLVLALVVPALNVSAQDEQITIRVWDHFGEASGDPAVQIYEQFMAENPNITIEREVIEAQTLKDLAPTALASGEGPDVLYFDINPARELFRGGLLIPLDQYAEEYGWYDRFYPEGISWSVIDDQLAGLGMEYEFVGVFINNDMFEEYGWEVPTNLEETLAFCKAANEEGIVPFAHGQNPGWQAYFSFTMPMHNTCGVDWVESRVFDGEGSWEDECVVDAIDVVYRQMRDAGCFDPDVNGIDWQTQQDLFYSWEAALLPTGTWVIGGILENMPDTNVTMMPFPATVEDGPRIYTTGMGSAWFVSSSSEHPDAAAKLVDFMFSDFAVKLWVEDAGFFPPVLVDPSSFELAPLTRFALETLMSTTDPDSGVQLGYNVDVLGPRPFATMMADGFQAVMAGLKSPEEQAADLQATWEAGE